MSGSRTHHLTHTVLFLVKDTKAAVPLPSEAPGLSGFSSSCKTEAKLLCLTEDPPQNKAVIDGLAPAGGITELAAMGRCLRRELVHYMYQSLRKVN